MSNWSVNFSASPASVEIDASGDGSPQILLSVMYSINSRPSGSITTPPIYNNLIFDPPYYTKTSISHTFSEGEQYEGDSCEIQHTATITIDTPRALGDLEDVNTVTLKVSVWLKEGDNKVLEQDLTYDITITKNASSTHGDIETTRSGPEEIVDYNEMGGSLSYLVLRTGDCESHLGLHYDNFASNIEFSVPPMQAWLDSDDASKYAYLFTETYHSTGMPFPSLFTEAKWEEIRNELKVAYINTGANAPNAEEMANNRMAEAGALEPADWTDITRPLYSLGSATSSGGGGGASTPDPLDFVAGGGWTTPQFEADTFRLLPVMEAGFANATRPGVGGNVEEFPHRYATIQVMNIDGTVFYTTTDFALTGIQKKIGEKFRTVSTFDGNHLSFIAEKNSIYQLTFTMIDSKSFDWVRDFKTQWDHIFRGSILASKKMRLYVLYKGSIIGGYPLSMTTNEAAKASPLSTMSIAMFITDDAILPTMTQIGDSDEWQLPASEIDSI